VIKLSEFQFYHVDCYKKDREEAYKNEGKLDQQYLRETSQNLDAFRHMVDSESISDSKSFHKMWGKQLNTVLHLESVMANAGISGTLGFLDKIRLGRQINRLRRTSMEIASLYRETYSALQIERSSKERFLSPADPTLDQLKEEERKLLNEIKEQINEWCNKTESVQKEMQRIAHRTSQKWKEEIRRQIQEIPKLVEIL